MLKIPDNATSPQRYLTYEQMTLINQFRQAAYNLAMWSYTYANALKDKANGSDAIYAKLHETNYQYSQLLSQFYGQEISESYLNLLTQFGIGFRSLLEAMFSGNQEQADASLKKMYQIIDEASNYFASLNPYWDREQWYNLLYQEVQLLYYLAFALETENHEQSIQIFDRLSQLTVIIGDYLARGIMASIAPIPSQESKFGSLDPNSL